MLIIFEINRVTTATIITSVAEYFRVKFVTCPSSKVIKVVPIVLKVIRMSAMN